jgi:hypothetical protein
MVSFGYQAYMRPYRTTRSALGWLLNYNQTANGEKSNSRLSTGLEPAGCAAPPKVTAQPAAVLTRPENAEPDKIIS